MDETIVIGAGPAGLAVAASVKGAVILERADAVGSSWRRHYRRLHLHTDRAHSTLPGLDFPKGTARWPSREQVIAYLEAYATHHRLAIRFGVSVLRVTRTDDGWAVHTDGETVRARRVVIATGYPRVPVIPSWPGTFHGPIVHSSQYADGAPYRDQRVLVVGFGNSGGELAIDLHEHGARPAMAVRSPVNVVPREILGLPILSIGIATRRLPARLADVVAAPMIRATVGDITKLGFQKLPYGPMIQIKEHGRIPLIDIGTLRLIREGHVTLLPDVRALDGDAVVFSDGRRERFDAIVAATGYRPRVDEILPGGEGLDEHGCPKVSGGEFAPGLYATGFYVAPTGMLRELGIEARRIARAMASERA